MAISKDSFVWTQDEEDIMIIDEDDNKYIIVDGAILCGCGDCVGTEADIEYADLAGIMLSRAVWYTGTNRILNKILRKVPRNSQLEFVIHIYKELNYPTMRDATCPQHCEGCLIKCNCLFCGQENSHCSSTFLRPEQSFCDNDCCMAYMRQETIPLIQKNIESLDNDIRQSTLKLDLIEKCLEQKGDLLDAKILPLTDKKNKKVKKIWRKDLMKLGASLTKNMYFNMYCYNIAVAVKKRDKDTYCKEFAKLKDIYVDFMDMAETDEVLLDFAKESKDNVTLMSGWGYLFFGIE